VLVWNAGCVIMCSRTAMESRVSRNLCCVFHSLSGLLWSAVCSIIFTIESGVSHNVCSRAAVECRICPKVCYGVPCVS